MFTDSKKPKQNGKDGQGKFDPLEEKKMSEKVAQMSLADKSGKKYSAQGTRENAVEKLRRSFRKNEKTSSQSLNLDQPKKKDDVTKRSASVEKSNELGLGLFEAANMMCNIVEITKDSTLRGRDPSASRKAPAMLHEKRDSNISNGPFSVMKEQEEKKKKKRSFEEDED